MADRMTSFGYNILAGGSAVSGVNAVNFDVNTWLSKSGAFTGAVESNKFTMSFWIKKDTSTAAKFVMQLASGFFSLQIDANAIDIHLLGRDNTSSLLLDVQAVGAVPDSATWYNILISMDLSDTGKRDIFVNDVSKSLTVNTYVSGNIDFDNTNTTFIGAASGSGSLPILSDMAEFWFEDDLFTDFSVEANRRKYIDASGKPVSLGSNGSAPNGTSPLIFQSGSTATWHTNKGTGGGLTENGTLTTATTSPSD